MHNPERLKTPSTIALIGYRGSGKTTVSRLLAEALNWECVDADDLIEATAGKSIAAIFAQDGERSFRDYESTVLEQVLSETERVIATGGGVILRPENRRLLQQSAYVVWLTATPETLWQRIAADMTTAARRPNLTAAGGISEITAMLAQREPLYRACSQVVVDTENRTPGAVVTAIHQQISRLWPNAGGSS